MAAVGRFLLILTLIAAPWVFGSVQPWPQFVLASVIASLSLLRLIEALVHRAEGPVHIPMAAAAPMVLLLIAALQLLPRDEAPSARMHHAVFADSAKEFEGPDHVGTGTLAPSSTRREATRLYFALAAFLLAAQWFSESGTHRQLYAALAGNGALLGAFGIIQVLSWNGMLFWTVNLRFGGTPFASYVNRNNAAGYLNLTMAATVGLGVFLLGMRTPQSPRSGPPKRPRLKRWDRMRLAIARVDGRHVALLGLLTLGVASLLFSMSRGGVLAMLAAGLAIAVTAFRGAGVKTLLGLGLLIGATTIGLIAFAGRVESIDERLDTLSDPLTAASGRLQHWQDTFSAVQDFPLTGTGFGTYRYANQPYQEHPSHAWYYNADNEWFEILVEMGTVGFAAMIAGFLLIAISSISLLRSVDPHWRAAGVVGLFMVVSQAVQAVTDFGLTIPANGLTFAVLGGAVCGAACRESSFYRLTVSPSLSLARLEGRPGQSLLAAVLAIASAAFLLEMLAVTDADSAQSDSLEINRDETRIAAIDADIAAKTEALRLRPDDADLHRAVGRLWIDRCEVQLYRRMLNDLPEKSRPTPAIIWTSSRLSALARRTHQLQNSGQQTEASRIRSLLAVRENLPHAKHHLEESLRHGSLGRGVALNLARLTAITSPSTSSPTTDLLKKAQFTAPSTAGVLVEIASLASASGDTILADQCWRRALTVAPSLGPKIWAMASQNRTVKEVISSAVPDRVDVMVAIAEGISDENAKQTLVEQAAKLVKPDDQSISPLIRAKLEDLQNHKEQAIQHYRLALLDHPKDIESRLRLARLLYAVGRLSEANSEYFLLQEQVPNRRDITKERTELLRELQELKFSKPGRTGT